VTTDTLVLPRVGRVPRHAARPAVVSRLVTAAPVVLILVAQVALTMRLIPYVGSDHGDEAIYIYGGHQLIHELLHGGGSPYYETWYSGAPVVYPVLAAVADHLGGIVLAREMSLAFMLCATVLLFATARRLFGYWVGITAIGLFIGLGVTQNLGALATYDAMALALMSAAAYCAVRSAASSRWLLAVPLALLAANATKYVTVLFDPVVVGLAAIQLASDGWRRVQQRLLALGVAVLVLTGTVVFLAGSAYVKGIMLTTLSRKSGTQSLLEAHSASTSQVVSLSWEWTGAVIVLGALALLLPLLRRPERRNGLVLMLLLGAGILVTLGNIRLHTAQSMDKHDDFGAWFACIPAAYLLARLADTVRRWRVKIPVLVVAAVAAGWCGWYYSQPANFTDYFSTQPLASYQQEQYGFLRPYLTGAGEFLLGSINASNMVYDNHSSIEWWQFFDDTYIKYPIPDRGGDPRGQAQGLVCGGAGQPPASDPRCMYLEAAAGYNAAIRAHWFGLITLVDNHQLSYDNTILAAVKSTPGYVLLTTQGGAPTYIYAPDYPAWERVHRAQVRSLHPSRHHHSRRALALSQSRAESAERTAAL